MYLTVSTGSYITLGMRSHARFLHPLWGQVPGVQVYGLEGALGRKLESHCTDIAWVSFEDAQGLVWETALIYHGLCKESEALILVTVSF